MKNKLFALALAGVTTIGALATGTSVMAETSGKTTVTLSIEEQNTSSYTLTVPSETKLNADGSATALEGGLTVSGENMTKGVKVTATSENNFGLKADNIKDPIWYILYADNIEKANYNLALEFTADEVNSGANKKLYVKTESPVSAETPAGEYSDVITFTAEAVGNSEISGGESETKGYKQVTTDNVDELLGTHASETYAYGDGSSDSAQQLASELLTKLSGKGINNVVVIYKMDYDTNAEKYKVYYCNAVREDGEAKLHDISLEYRFVQSFPDDQSIFTCVLDNK